jgi:hypothetical protein
MTALIIGADRSLVAPAPRSRPKLAGATLLEDKKLGSPQERAHGGDLMTGSQEMGTERYFVGEHLEGARLGPQPIREGEESQHPERARRLKLTKDGRLPGGGGVSQSAHNAEGEQRVSGGCLAGGRVAEADLMNVIGAASDYPNTPLLASDINTNPTLEKRDNSAVGLSLTCRWP